jgi:membrane protein
MHQGANGWMDLSGLLARVRRVYVVDLIWRTAERYGREDGPIFATAVAFRLLMSIFPLLIVFVAVFGLLTELPGFGPWLERVTADHAPGDTLKSLVESITGVPVTSNSVAGLVGLATLIWSASGMFGTLRRALNRAFGVADDTELVGAYARNVVGVGGLFLLALLFIGMTSALSVVRGLIGPLLDDWPQSLAGGLWDRLLTCATSTLIALLLYRLVPTHGPPTRALWPAALIAGAGFQLSEVGFAIYQTYFSNFEAIYGALAGAVALLIFLNLEATIILFGAVFAAELARDRKRPPAS